MNSFDDVSKFMYACDQNDSDFGPQANLYLDLVIEEFRELVVAFGNRDMVEIADACAENRPSRIKKIFLSHPGILERSPANGVFPVPHQSLPAFYY